MFACNRIGRLVNVPVPTFEAWYTLAFGVGPPGLTDTSAISVVVAADPPTSVDTVPSTVLFTTTEHT